MLINEYIKLIKKRYGKKRLNRLKYFYVYLDEEQNVNGLCFVYRKNVDGQKGERFEDYPQAKLDVYEDVQGKRCYAQVSLNPLQAKTYYLD